MADEQLADQILEILRSEGESRTELAEHIAELVEREHHCASCDMHSCGDLDRGAVPLAQMSFEQFAQVDLPQERGQVGGGIHPA